MKKTVLKEYAELIVKKGINVQKGQPVIINASLDQPDFIAMLVKEAYKAGASRVKVDFSYDPITKLSHKYMKLKEMSKVMPYQLAEIKYRAEALPAMIHILSSDPDAFKGDNHQKIAKAQQARYPIVKPYLDSMDNKYQWCIAAVPGKKWAKKIFPELSTNKAVEKLWEAILYTARADKNPLETWDKHNKYLLEKSSKLNSLDIDYLHYQAKNGTDFKVWLLENTQWIAGGETTPNTGVYYNPNMPSEECFISPLKGKAEGIVYSSKPLSYQCQLIEDFSIRFENGKVKEVHARTNEDVLKTMVNLDEGASMLGEVALVPYDSPISNSGITFYETLFDENAACHLALGAGFTNCYKGFENYTHQEIVDKGINDSMIHVDFMIGTKDLNITAHLRNGQTVMIFKDGNWAI